MGLFRFGVLVDDPDIIVSWLSNHISDNVVRCVGYKTVLGVHVKIVLDDPEAADAFKLRWSEDLWERQVAIRRTRKE